MMKNFTLLRIVFGGILAGLAYYYTVDAIVYFYMSQAVADSYISMPHWILFAFRAISGLTFAFLYWRAGAAIQSMSWFMKGLFIGVMFALLNETLVSTHLYEFVARGHYLTAIETVLSALLINIIVGYLIVAIVPVHPIGEKK